MTKNTIDPYLEELLKANGYYGNTEENILEEKPTEDKDILEEPAKDMVEELVEQRCLKQKREIENYKNRLEKSLYQRQLENILAEALRKTEIQMTLEYLSGLENHDEKTLLHQFMQEEIDSTYTRTSGMQKQTEIMSQDNIIYHLLEAYLCYDFRQIYYMKYQYNAYVGVICNFKLNRLELDKLNQICGLELDTEQSAGEFIESAFKQSNIFQAYHQLSPENQKIVLEQLIHECNILVSVAIEHPNQEIRMRTPNCKPELENQFETYHKQQQQNNAQL